MMDDMDTGGGIRAEDHPSSTDPAYRRRRDEIAAISATWRPGGPIPDIGYRAEEHEVWTTVRRHLAPLHLELAAREYNRGEARLALPEDRVPELSEIDRRLHGLSGFNVDPAPGLVPVRDFFGGLARGHFNSTQYLRHPASPLYTPEPDLIHEVVGHCCLLADHTFADLHRAAGRCALRCESDAALAFFANVFWFTIEFGVVDQEGVPHAYGAGLVSSFGEIQVFRDAEIREFDLVAMGTQSYDITRYQPVLFSIGSTSELADRLGSFFDTFDDEMHHRLLHPHAA